MQNSQIRALVVLLISLAISTGLVVSAQYQQTHTGPLSTIAICAILAFGIQWLAFIPAYLKQTERFYDLTGSVTFIAVTFYAIVNQPLLSVTSILLAAMVVIWAARLGTFLFMRINKDGIDGRFDEIKPDKYRFFAAWTLQGLWVLITAGAALTVITSVQQAHTHWLTWCGLAIWLFGFLFEVIADDQKFRFKQDPNNHKQFIHNGLWGYSRHPNYFGEITLWFGVAIAALPVLTGWQHVALISPLFVTLLLTKVSGVPLLEQRADQKWQNNPDYQAYKSRTPVLVPKFTK